MFEDLQKDEKTNQCQFLIAKQQNGEPLTDLDLLLSAESFSDEDTETVDDIMKQIGDIDDDTASAIGDLLLAVTSHPAIAKSCEANWESITGIEQVEIPCLVQKSSLNRVEEFIQKFATKAEMESAELEIISDSLETISDLGETSLVAVHSLLKVSFSEAAVNKWPSLFLHVEGSDTSDIDAVANQEPVKKSGLKWPSLVSRT